MAHLTCFAGGMIALGSQIDPKLSDSEKQRQMKVRVSTGYSHVSDFMMMAVL